MSTKALIPGNSQRARSTALNAFERFAVAEGFTVNAIYEFVGGDSTGDTLYIVLDKFAVYLAFKESSKGSLLSKNSVASYFGNVKNHLLELFPALSAVSGRRLQKIASILDKYCSKRGTYFTHQAPPCTKSDLRSLTLAILKGAVSVQDYQDPALLNILWYLLDRGGWSMSAVSKAFNYIVGTTQEDQTVGKSLAGWDLKASPRLPTLDDFDPLVLHRIRQVQDRLFSAAKGFTERLSLRDDVVDVLTATAILHYPDMLRLRPESLYIERVQEVLSQVQAAQAEIAAWSMAIHRTLQPSKNDTPRSPAPRRVEDDELLRRQTLLLKQQAQILGGLAAEVKALNQREQRLEHPSDVTTAPSTTAADSLSSSSSALSDTASGAATRAHSRAKPLATVWYEWFLPPLPSARPNRRRYHECKVAVACMRVFLPAGYSVTGDEVTAKGRILSSGREAEANVLAFLEAENVKAKSHGTIVKVLKRMYAQGKLDDRIRNHQRLQQEGKALEDAPVHVLEPYNNHSTT
ncbi:hypothetical protein PHYSODRAFT_335926 [Phytophthora sojae]|uniref:Uncharacterized protein n=1 Tax=Phytophthora sojae (strain P6497) TaxID=1094619 RepID=G4ZR57_PHYSP|nr:hypothetical protein PHYSODRAFT_335926 [Phytophthora sojae]EGZ14279.1 hypothetical protein PHYSODRAFT_335926 [Phytophthora sojae]|eukprot:XP_009531708.1 hypothetical protein PHYSODRAFT_335926 [Phytophthora sojae]